MDLSVTFTINFAYILYPIMEIIVAWTIVMISFTVVMASANAKDITHYFQIVGRMLFRPSCYSLSLNWLIRDVFWIR